MKNQFSELKLLLCVGLATAVFFLPNGVPTLVGATLAAIFGITLVTTSSASRGAVRHQSKTRHRIAIARKFLRTLPFIGFVVICNGLLDSWVNAGWISFRLAAVCAIMIVYAAATPNSEIACAVTNLLKPLRRLGLDSEDVYLLVSISLTLMPILRKTLQETRLACRAKGVSWNLRTARAALLRTSWQMLARIDQMDMALTAKGV